MKRWFWGFLSGIFLIMALFMVGAYLGWRARSQPPEVAENTTLVLEIAGDVPEQISPDLSGQLLGERSPVTFVPLLRNIEKAAADSRITGLVLKVSRLGMGWAKAQQLRRALEDFKRRGKPVYALFTTAGSREYFLASVADKVYCSPAGVLDLKGMRAEVMFFKDTLGKIGVQADLEQIGRYKNFADQFTDNRMSNAFREATTSMLDSVYGNFLTAIAAARHRSADEIRNLIEQTGPFEAERAKLAGLVDDLLYEDQVFDLLRQGDKPFHKMTLREYHRVPFSQVGLGGGERIALVYAVGAITGGEDGFDPLSDGKTMGADSMGKTLESVAEDDSIKGVVLRIDSPGGDALASDEIWRKVVLLREKKPMVISMSDTAASGGYYIAMTGDPIVAEAGTLTGSIGVIYGKLSMRGFYDKIGLHKEIISRGKFSRIDSDYAPYTPEERERIRTLIQDFYRKFLARVGSARNMTPEAVDELAQGRVWTGEQAQRNGLVDELGGLPRALELLKEKAGIRPEARVELVEFPKRKSLFELLLSRAGQDELDLPAGLSGWISWLKRGALPLAGPLLARMPYSVSLD